MSGTQLDPSIISNAMVQIGQNDGPQNMQGWMAVKNANLQNQLLQSQQASGADFQKAINPQTGQVDYSKYNALLAGDPRAAFSAQDASQTALANQATAQANLQAEAKTYVDRHNLLAGIAYGWTQNPNLTRSNVMDDVAAAIAQKAISPQDGATVVKNFDQNNPNGWSAQEFKVLLGQGGQFTSAFPQYGNIDTGSGKIIANRDPITGRVSPVATVTNGVTPEFQSTPQTFTGSNGVSYTGTPGQLGEPMPQAAFTPVGSGTGGASAPTTARAGGGEPTGYGAQGLAPIGAPPQQQGSTQMGVTSPARGAGLFSNGAIAVAPGTVASAQDIAADQTTQFKNDVNTGNNTAQDISNLYEIGAAARSAVTGVGADEKEYALKVLNPIGQLLGFSGNTVDSTQVLDKAVGMLQQSNMTGFGASSDAKLSAAMGITPNKTMTQGGIQATVAMTLGNRLYQQHLSEAAQEWLQNGGNPADPQAGYYQFKNQFQKMTSPLIMSLPFMGQSQLSDLQSYIKTLPKQQQAQFNAQFKASSDAGYLSVPGQ